MPDRTHIKSLKGHKIDRFVAPIVQLNDRLNECFWCTSTLNMSFCLDSGKDATKEWAQPLLRNKFIDLASYSTVSFAHYYLQILTAFVLLFWSSS